LRRRRLIILLAGLATGVGALVLATASVLALVRIEGDMALPLALIGGGAAILGAGTTVALLLYLIDSRRSAASTKLLVDRSKRIVDRSDRTIASLGKQLEAMRTYTLGLETRLDQRTAELGSAVQLVGRHTASLLQTGNSAIIDEVQARFRSISDAQEKSHAVIQEVTAKVASRDALEQLSAAIRSDMRATSNDLYSQVEAAFAIYTTLPPSIPLPPMGDWAISPDAAAHYLRHILGTKPGVIVEAGSGVSTVLAAMAVRQNGSGRVISLEHDLHFAENTRRALKEQGVESHAVVLDAPLVQYTFQGEAYSWYDISGLDLDEDIDLLFVDGPPSPTNRLARYPAMSLLSRWITPGTVILVDDAARPDEVEMIDRWEREFGPLEVISLKHSRGTAQIRKLR
jgi:predicted O-methyltransferase YrrM